MGVARIGCSSTAAAAVTTAGVGLAVTAAIRMAVGAVRSVTVHGLVVSPTGRGGSGAGLQ